MARHWSVAADHLNGGDIDVTGAITLALWARPADVTTTGKWRSLLVKRLDGVGNWTNYGFDKDATNPAQLRFYLSVGATFHIWRTTNANLVANAWQHLAVTYNGAANPVLTVNGTATTLTRVSGTGFPALSTNNADTRIGGSGDPGDPDANWRGGLAEVGIWNAALAAAEIGALARGRLPFDFRRANLLAYVPLYGRAAPEPDYAVPGRVWTVNGTTASNHAPVEPWSRRFWGVAFQTAPPPSDSITGAAAVAVNAFGLLRATGKLTGAATVSVSATGDLVGIGRLRGERPPPTGTGLGLLFQRRREAATPTVTVTAAGQAVAEARLRTAKAGSRFAGFLLALRTQGEPVLAARVTATGTLTTTSPVTGAASVAVTAAGSLTGEGRLAGSATVTVTATGQAAERDTDPITGAAVVTTSAAGTLHAAGRLQGTAAVTTAAAGTLRAAGRLRARRRSGYAGFLLALRSAAGPALTARVTATGAAVGDALLTGAAAVTTSATGDLRGLGIDALQGSAQVTVSAAGTLRAAGKLTGAATVSVAATGVATAAGRLYGAAAVAVAASGDLSQITDGPLAGAASVTTDATGLLVAWGRLAGAAGVTTSGTGTLRGRGRLAGAAHVTVTASLGAEPGPPPVDVFRAIVIAEARPRGTLAVEAAPGGTVAAEARPGGTVTAEGRPAGTLGAEPGRPYRGTVTPEEEG